MTTSSDHQPADLRDYIRVVRARKVEIGLMTLVLLGAGLLITFRQTPLYEGSAKVLVRPVQSATTSIPFQQTPNLDTERELMSSEAVAGKVRQDLQLSTTEETLLANLRVTVVTDTEVMVVRFDDPDPNVAAMIANGFAQAYVDYREEQALSQLQAAESAVQARIDTLQDQLRSTSRQIELETSPVRRDALQAQRDTMVAQLGVLQQRILDLQANASVNQSGAAQVIQPAKIPTSPVSPNKVRNAVLALFAGLALGIGLAFLRERLDDRIKSRHELEKRLGAPVIAAVPKVGGWRSREEAHLVLRSNPKSPVSEAYRTLGTNVQYLASQQALRVIMITSSLGGDGKSTTSSNLAIVLAQAGKRVILVSADLRRPRIHHFFDLRNDVGMSNVLADSTGLAQVAKDPGINNLRVIVGGPIPQDPAALLGSRRASEFLESLRKVSDFAIIDTPPVLAVADASILAPLVDGTIFVVDSERSSRSALAQARDQLENAGANILGAVYNNFDPHASSYYPSSYYYSYYYTYYSSEDEGANGSGKGSGRWSLRRARKSLGRGKDDSHKAASNGSGRPRRKRDDSPVGAGRSPRPKPRPRIDMGAHPMEPRSARGPESRRPGRSLRSPRGPQVPI